MRFKPPERSVTPPPLWASPFRRLGVGRIHCKIRRSGHSKELERNREARACKPVRTRRPNPYRDAFHFDASASALPCSRLLVADEVVIVDPGSTDRTKELAEAAGATVFDQPWLGNGAQKRAAEERCRNDWLLDLDADEIVTEELAASIRALFQDGAPDAPIYELELVTVPPYGERWNDFSLAYRRKLYDRRVIRMPDHKAWDQLEVPAGMQVRRLAGSLDHYSFSGVEQYVGKLNKVSGVRARESRLKSRLSVVLRVLFAFPFYFLRHYLVRGHWKAGLYGYAIAVSAALGRWLRDVKMLEKHMTKEGKRRPEYDET